MGSSNSRMATHWSQRFSSPGGCHRQTAALKWLLSHLAAAHLGGHLYSRNLSPVGMDRHLGQPWLTNVGESSQYQDNDDKSGVVARRAGLWQVRPGDLASCQLDTS